MDWGACERTSQCVIRPASCCGNCGAASRDDIIALNQNELNLYATEVCEGMGCAACYMPTDANLIAICEGGRCEVIDLFESPITACEATEQCRVRTNDCCECDGGTTEEDLIAINIEQEMHFSLLVCDPNSGCDDCAPQYPDSAQAFCEEGRCWVF